MAGPFSRCTSATGGRFTSLLKWATASSLSLIFANIFGKFMNCSNETMTEKERMLAGEIYSAVDPQLIEELTEVKEVIHDYNLLRPSEKDLLIFT